MTTGGPSFKEKIVAAIRKDRDDGNLERIAYIQVDLLNAVFLLTNEMISSSQLEQLLLDVHWNRKEFTVLVKLDVDGEALIFPVIVCRDPIPAKGGGHYNFATMTSGGQVVGEETKTAAA